MALYFYEFYVMIITNKIEKDAKRGNMNRSMTFTIHKKIQDVIYFFPLCRLLRKTKNTHQHATATSGDKVRYCRRWFHTYTVKSNLATTIKIHSLDVLYDYDRSPAPIFRFLALLFLQPRPRFSLVPLDLVSSLFLTLFKPRYRPPQ